MIDLLILFLFLVSGAALGWFSLNLMSDIFLEQVLFSEFFKEQVSSTRDLQLILLGFGALIGITMGFIFQKVRKNLFTSISTTPTDLLISRSVGLILGLLVANLVLAPVLLFPFSAKVVLIKPLIAVFSNIFFGLIGINLGEIHGRTLLRLFNPNSTEALLIAEGILTPASAKILDTSVIIDGRIKELLRCGVIEGQIIVAQTVIDELQQLADSSNNEKRAKGRRGLKLLNNLRTTYGRRIALNATKYEGAGTDDRLLKLTSDTGGTLITADYNLSQVGNLQDLKVLNLSELIIALRPDVQPGEKLLLKIVREGKESSQGVGYLDDGTMVVIEGARDFIGKKIDIIVTGALQTPTGRMIFGKMGKSENSS
tara:strand:+ start:1522 stop:2631 length:1110 start_codon:yes stop_codon:yes gene_type:complete